MYISSEHVSFLCYFSLPRVQPSFQPLHKENSAEHIEKFRVFVTVI